MVRMLRLKNVIPSTRWGIYCSLTYSHCLLKAAYFPMHFNTYATCIHAHDVIMLTGKDISHKRKAVFQRYLDQGQTRRSGQV